MGRVDGSENAPEHSQKAGPHSSFRQCQRRTKQENNVPGCCLVGRSSVPCRVFIPLSCGPFALVCRCDLCARWPMKPETRMASSGRHCLSSVYSTCGSWRLGQFDGLGQKSIRNLDCETLAFGHGVFLHPLVNLSLGQTTLEYCYYNVYNDAYCCCCYYYYYSCCCCGCCCCYYYSSCYCSYSYSSSSSCCCCCC